MKNFTITSPIITIETEEQRALLHKLYPGICHPDPQNHVLIAQEFTLEELSDLKAKLAIADRLMQMGNFKISQIEFDSLNREQAIYLKNRSKQNVIYTHDWEECTAQIDEGIHYPTIPDSRGPWRAEVNETFTKSSLDILYAELDKLK